MESNKGVFISDIFNVKGTNPVLYEKDSDENILYIDDLTRRLNKCVSVTINNPVTTKIANRTTRLKVNTKELSNESLIEEVRKLTLIEEDLYKRIDELSLSKAGLSSYGDKLAIEKRIIELAKDLDNVRESKTNLLAKLPNFRYSDSVTKVGERTLPEAGVKEVISKPMVDKTMLTISLPKLKEVASEEIRLNKEKKEADRKAKEAKVFSEKVEASQELKLIDELQSKCNQKKYNLLSMLDLTEEQYNEFVSETFGVEAKDYNSKKSIERLKNNDREKILSIGKKRASDIILSFKGENNVNILEDLFYSDSVNADSIYDSFEGILKNDFSDSDILEIYNEDFYNEDMDNLFDSYAGKSQVTKIMLGKKRINKFCTKQLINADKEAKKRIGIEKIKNANSRQRDIIFKKEYLPILRDITSKLPKNRNRCKRIIINQINKENK